MSLKFKQFIRLYSRFTVKSNGLKNITADKKIQKVRPLKISQESLQVNEINKNSSTDSVQIPEYSKIQDLDALLKKTMVSIKSKKNREKGDRILLEGKRLIKDAVFSGILPETLFFSRVEDMKSLLLPEDGVHVYKLPYKTIALWSDMTTCPGIMAICKTPPVHLKKPAIDSLRLTVVCDNVREPGNLGAILRVAAGVGCEKIILTKGCVDLWEPKVLRAGAGSHFKLQIHKNVTLSEVNHFISTDTSIFLADNKTTLISELDDNQIVKDGEISREALNRFIPIVPYDAVDFAMSKSVVIVIGGETEGLSNDVMKWAVGRNGHRIHIPLKNEVDSLNTGTALGIILFEIKRQLSTVHDSKNYATISSE